MDLEQERIRGNDAQSLLNNKLLKEAFDRVGHYIEQKALSLDPNDKEKAVNVIISKQILAGVKREIERVIEDGEMAKVRIEQIEEERKLFKFRR